MFFLSPFRHRSPTAPARRRSAKNKYVEDEGRRCCKDYAEHHQSGIQGCRFKQDCNVQGNGLTLQIGDTNKDYQKVTVSIDDMSSKGIGLSGLDLSNQDAAGAAIDTIKNAVNIVS